jgi:GAF domain-containing protein
MVAFAGYPLAVEGRVVGVLALFARHALSETVLADLAPLADAVAQCIERKRGEQALRESEGRHRFLADLAAATQALTDPEEVMEVTARMLGRHLGADRCAYAEVEDEAVFVITGNYTDGVPSIVGRWPVAAFGPELVRLMAANEPYVLDDVEADPRAGADLAAYRATTIRASSASPCTRGGSSPPRWPSTRRTRRCWTPEEIRLVRTVVGRCWESIERARVARDLRRARSASASSPTTCPPASSTRSSTRPTAPAASPTSAGAWRRCAG